MKHLVPVCALALSLVAAIGTAQADSVEVDVALVLAVDISRSMDPDEQALQRQGYIDAFRAPAVHDAIDKGAIGSIAIVYMEWAGADNQRVVVPWTILEGAEDSVAFAERLAANPPPVGAPRTSISGAIDYAVALLETSAFEAVRRVIDVSGDGPNNQGRPVTHARDAALAKGITINGLPIMLQRPTSVWDIQDLDLYYRDCVIGGAGAFMIPVREPQQFAEAIRTKIIREIATIGDDAPEVVLAQAEQGANCFVGEARSRQWSPY